MTCPLPRNLRRTLLLLTFLFASAESSEASGDEEIFPVTVTVNADSIAFSWDVAATSEGVLRRRLLGESGWTNDLTTLGVGQTTFTDTTVQVGQSYEYGFEYRTNPRFYAYVASGINIPLPDSRGKLILLVDETMATPCADELEILTRDLVGDGWFVIRHDVPRNDDDDLDGFQSIAIKDVILSEYDADPTNVKAVLLFGHVPIPYSGDNIPDGHFFRPLPADGYYGEIDGVWTDTRDYSSKASQSRWVNVAGDGKFDQYTFPSDVDLLVGRIDLSSLPSFASSEVELLKRYVGKAHAWRHGLVEVDQKAVLAENREWNWGPWNFIRQFGLEAATRNETTALFADRNLFAYFGNTGSFTSAGPIETSALAGGNVNAVFAFEGGSYSVDWDTPDALMRAFVASSGTTLASGWSEFPGYYFHHMGVGQPIGFSIRTMQNASKADYKENYFTSARAIHHCLQGDPTIRLHPVAPPSRLSATDNGSDATISWNASTDPQVIGYDVFRADSVTDPFTKLNSGLVNATRFVDATSRSGDVVYMVRAVKLELSTGNYFNGSQGMFVPLRAEGTSNASPIAFERFVIGEKATEKQLTLSGSDPDGDPLTYVVIENPAFGLLNGAGGDLSYTPFEGVTGYDVFRYIAIDRHGAASDPQSVNVLVQGGTDDPVANVRIEAESFDGNSGVALRVQEDALASFGNKVGEISGGDWLRFDDVAFGTGVTTLDLAVSTATSGGRMEIRLDEPDGLVVGEVDVRDSDSTGWSDYTTISIWLNSIVQDNHDLYFVFGGEPGRTIDFDWFQFNADDLTFAMTIEAEAYDSQAETSVGTDGATAYVDYNVEFGHLQWDSVDGNLGGVTPITFVYANGSGIEQTGNLAFRSPKETIGKVFFPDTGGWDQWSTVSVDVDLRPGLNELRLVTNGAYSGMPRLRLDKFVIGVDGVPTPGAKTEAEGFAEGSGVTVTNGGSGQVISSGQSGSWARFARFNFGSNAGRVEVSASRAGAGGTIEFRLDAVDGPLLATAVLSEFGGSQIFETKSFELVETPTRIHDLYLVTRGGGGSPIEIDWFQFSPSVQGTYSGTHRPGSPPTVEIVGNTFSIVFARDLTRLDQTRIPQVSLDLGNQWLSGADHLEEVDLGSAGDFQFFRATSKTGVSEEPAQFMRVITEPTR